LIPFSAEFEKLSLDKSIEEKDKKEESKTGEGDKP